MNQGSPSGRHLDRDMEMDEINLRRCREKERDQVLNPGEKTKKMWQGGRQKQMVHRGHDQQVTDYKNIKEVKN